MQDYKQFVGLSIPIKMLGKIDELAERHRLRGRASAIRQLLEIGLFIESKVGLVESWTAEDLEQIKQQYKDGQLVDWISNLELKEFSTLMHIFDEERKARGLKK